MSQNPKSEFARALAATVPPEEFMKLKAEQLSDPKFQDEILKKFRDSDDLTVQAKQMYNMVVNTAAGTKVKRRPANMLETRIAQPTAIDIAVGSCLWLNAAFFISANTYSPRTMRLSRAEAAALCSVAFNELYGIRLYAAPTDGYKTMFERGFIVLSTNDEDEIDYVLTVAAACAWQQLTAHYLDFVLMELNNLMHMIQETQYGIH